MWTVVVVLKLCKKGQKLKRLCCEFNTMRFTRHEQVSTIISTTVNTTVPQLKTIIN